MTGVFTGAYAMQSADRRALPIWVADYVLAQYGTGAIMGVPAHDERDLSFARSSGCRCAVVVAAVAPLASLHDRTWLHVGTLMDSVRYGHAALIEAAERDQSPGGGTWSGRAHRRPIVCAIG